MKMPQWKVLPDGTIMVGDVVIANMKVVSVGK